MTVYDLTRKRVWVAGSRGLVGEATTRRLQQENCTLITNPNKLNLNLKNKQQAFEFVQKEKPNVIVLAAARVGGIVDNDAYPADYLIDNLLIQTHVIEAAAAHNVERFIFLGSSCIYPKDAHHPLQPHSLMTGALEDTNRAYATAKLAGIELIKAIRKQHKLPYITAMPCNLYGMADRFMFGERPHVIPALLHKFKHAMETNADHVTIWGTGTPLREFLHADDLADALVFCSKHYDSNDPINIGSGEEISICALAEMMRDITGFQGDLVFDQTKPDGVARKLMDSTPLNTMGWTPSIPLQEGLQRLWTYYADQAQPERYSHG